MITQLYSLAPIHFADNYGAGTYNQSVYGANGTTTTSTGSSSGGGTLANTGIFVIGFVVLAALVLLAAMIVRMWRRPSKRSK